MENDSRQGIDPETSENVLADTRRHRSVTFLKLGGSLITEKDHPYTPRIPTIRRLASEIAAAQGRNPDLHLLLGHGSGSFGHVPAHKYRTRDGVSTPEQWRGFSEVWYQAAKLNRYIMDALHECQMPAIAFPPSAGISGRNGEVLLWNLWPLITACEKGLIPVVYGDVIFDTASGGRILSTEDLFAYLARQLHPARILIAGREPGIWGDYPSCTHILPEISVQNFNQMRPIINGSTTTDVTGGMSSKVEIMLKLTQDMPGLEVHIFSGDTPGQVEKVLRGASAGTRIGRAQSQDFHP